MIVEGERTIEAPREESETAFTQILRALRARHPEVLAAVFVDQEGECVDYASCISAFDAKIVGAEMRVLLDMVDRTLAQFGQTQVIELVAEDRELFVRRLDGEYALVLSLTVGMLRPRLLETVEETVDRLVAEAGLEGIVLASTRPPPASDPRMRVETRPAVGWSYAPVWFAVGEERTWIADVMGRWIEGGDEGELVCFRVRTHEGAELTLAHDPARNDWFERTGS